MEVFSFSVELRTHSEEPFIMSCGSAEIRYVYACICMWFYAHTMHVSLYDYLYIYLKLRNFIGHFLDSTSRTSFRYGKGGYIYIYIYVYNIYIYIYMYINAIPDYIIRRYASDGRRRVIVFHGRRS
jgi:hypothetical protein